MSKMPTITFPGKAAGVASSWKKQPAMVKAAVMLGVPAVVILAMLSRRRGGGSSLPLEVTSGGEGAYDLEFANLSDQLVGIDESITALGDELRPENNPGPVTTPPPPPTWHGDPDIDPGIPTTPYPIPTTPPPTTKPPTSTPTPLPTWKPVVIPGYVMRDVAEVGRLGDSGQKQVAHLLNVAGNRGITIPDWVRGQVAAGKLGDAGRKAVERILGALRDPGA